MQGLRDRCGQVTGLKLGEGGAKNFFGRADAREQASGETRAQSGREGEPQPIEGSIEFHGGDDTTRKLTNLSSLRAGEGGSG